MPKPNDDLSLLHRLTHYKSVARPAAPSVGGEMLDFYRSVQKRQPKLANLSRAWQQLVPQMFHHHTCLESFVKGTLTVLVDSSPHLFELRQLLASGLEKQLTVACKTAGLKKVALKPGTWYDPESKAPRF
jgi:hypothetical protein